MPYNLKLGSAKLRLALSSSTAVLAMLISAPAMAQAEQRIQLLDQLPRQSPSPNRPDRDRECAPKDPGNDRAAHEHGRLPGPSPPRTVAYLRDMC